jgi:hypothetical protein
MLMTIAGLSFGEMRERTRDTERAVLRTPPMELVGVRIAMARLSRGAIRVFRLAVGMIKI